MNKIISDEPAKWLERAKWYEENEEWLDKSARIAIKILHELRAKKITQKELADAIGVTAQYINKVVKGGENLGLETICKIEKALGINLISVPQFESNQLLVKGNSSVAANINRNNAQPIGSEKHTYHNKSKYQPEKETFAENEMHFA
jgi:transcriptional regulator with XRE-family HTH domain